MREITGTLKDRDIFRPQSLSLSLPAIFDTDYRKGYA